MLVSGVRPAASAFVQVVRRWGPCAAVSARDLSALGLGSRLRLLIPHPALQQLLFVPYAYGLFLSFSDSIWE